MCGIAGVFNLDGHPVDEGQLRVLFFKELERTYGFGRGERNEACLLYEKGKQLHQIPFVVDNKDSQVSTHTVFGHPCVDRRAYRQGRGRSICARSPAVNTAFSRCLLRTSPDVQVIRLSVASQGGWARCRPSHISPAPGLERSVRCVRPEADAKGDR